VVLGSAHLGVGKTLFQLGWQSLADSPYPEQPDQTPDMSAFDELVRKKLDEMRGKEESAGGSAAMESLITNWADAVRHFDSALDATPGEEAATHNRRMVMTYLKRLRELLEEDSEQTEQSMPQPQQGEGQPKPEEEGEGKPEKNDQNGKPKDKGQQQEGDQGDQEDQQPRNGEGDQEQKPDDKSGKKKDEEAGEKEPANPDETPEERARRILKENADIEKGPLTPGHIEFNPPEKDW
jgi:hypothetical protein